MPLAARPLARLTVGWALLADTIPLYALYALWFADSGLSDGQISVLFILGSAVGFVGEVPSGALADRFSRRGCLIAAGVLQAAGYTIWTLLPGFTGFAVGFVLWGISGTLVSGAFEALLFDGLTEVGAQDHYQRILGAVTAVTLAAQLPAAVAATVLFSLGGYSLVGWVSIAVCIAAAALATRLPEPARHGGDEDTDLGYLATLKSGLTTVIGDRAVGLAVVAVALLVGLDGLDEYFPLLAQDWQVATAAVPLAILAIPVVGAIGAACAGSSSRLSPRTLAAALAVALVLLGTTALLHQPVGLVGVAIFYGVYQWVQVGVDARLQHRITGSARATITSVASLGAELAAIGLYLGWAAGGLGLIAVAGLLLAAGLPRLLRDDQ